MTISSLAITFSEIRARVAWELHGSRDVSGLSSEETDNITSVIDSGYRKFLRPEVGHRWSFLQVEFRLPLQNGIDAYEMPHDFGGVIGDLHFQSDDNGYGTVTKRLMNDIQNERSANTQTDSYPRIFAEVVTRNTVTSGQLWKLHVYPAPDAAYTLVGMQSINPDALTSSSVYPYGAVEHGETVLMACLAAAEQQLDGGPGTFTQQFQQALMASIQKDQRDHAPEVYGYNGDGRHRSLLPLREGKYYEDYSAVIYEG